MTHALCGRLMYLAESLTDLEGRVWPMAGVLPAAVVESRPRRALDQRAVSLRSRRANRLRGRSFLSPTEN